MEEVEETDDDEEPQKQRKQLLRFNSTLVI
jgi:hypothetical protein